jgi:aryl-alcohol dehydrogenase-like predicted oxidoreductase
MEYRQLGHSGLKVSALSFGAGTFGGGNEFFRAWGDSGVEEAIRLVDVCLDAGINLFDTADVYSSGLSEEVLGKAVSGKRQRLLISTKATFRSRSKAACAASARITSTSITCTASTRQRPSMRRSTLSTAS